MTNTTTRKRRDFVEEALEHIVGLRGSPIPEQAEELELLLRGFWREELREELELRVGLRMSAGLSSDTLNQFEALYDAGNNEAATQWMETHVPHYRQIVSEELDRLVVEAAEAFTSVRIPSAEEVVAHA